MSRSGGYKCYNFRCGSCIGKTLCGEPGDGATKCDNRIVSLKTNADRIRAMEDEELTEFFGRVARTAGCPPPNQMDCMDDCEKCWGVYLGKPAEED